MTPAADPRTWPALGIADPDPGQPIPYTLTAKAHAVLDQDDTMPGTAAGPGPAEWGCDRCGAAYLGTSPDDGLCLACRAAEDGR